jgi:hypothetical protein
LIQALPFIDLASHAEEHTTRCIINGLGSEKTITMVDITKQMTFNITKIIYQLDGKYFERISVEDDIFVKEHLLI